MNRRLWLRLVFVALLCLFAGADQRSGQWPAVRRAHLQGEPACVACGRGAGLEVHHVLPFHANPRLELDAENLITLCRRDHLTFGHFGDFKRYNPRVREHAEVYRQWRKEWER